MTRPIKGLSKKQFLILGGNIRIDMPPVIGLVRN